MYNVEKFQSYYHKIFKKEIWKITVRGNFYILYRPKEGMFEL